MSDYDWARFSRAELALIAVVIAVGVVVVVSVVYVIGLPLRWWPEEFVMRSSNWYARVAAYPARPHRAPHYRWRLAVSIALAAVLCAVLLAWSQP